MEPCSHKKNARKSSAIWVQRLFIMNNVITLVKNHHMDVSAFSILNSRNLFCFKSYWYFQHPRKCPEICCLWKPHEFITTCECLSLFSNPLILSSLWVAFMGCLGTVLHRRWVRVRKSWEDSLKDLNPLCTVLLLLVCIRLSFLLFLMTVLYF